MANLGWAWPFPNIPANGEPAVLLNGQQYGHTGWIRPHSNTDYHDGFDFDASRYNGTCLAVLPGMYGFNHQMDITKFTRKVSFDEAIFM